MVEKDFMDKTNIANLPREALVTETAKIGISGMTCDNCVRKVEGALGNLPGVKEVKVVHMRTLRCFRQAEGNTTKLVRGHVFDSHKLRRFPSR